MQTNTVKIEPKKAQPTFHVKDIPISQHNREKNEEQIFVEIYTN